MKSNRFQWCDLKELRVWVEQVHIVLMTAVEVEQKALLEQFTPPPGQKKVLCGYIGHELYYIGTFGGKVVVATQCRMGSIGSSSSTLATQQAAEIWQPNLVVMVGIAFGKSAATQNLGDVILAQSIISYEQFRIGETANIYRGREYLASQPYLNRIIDLSKKKQAENSERLYQVRCCSLLSGEKLVDNAVFKEQLFAHKSFENACGGEMEGVGVATAAKRAGVKWLLLKAICDWGDGEKNDDAQPLAAKNAVAFLQEVFTTPGILDDLEPLSLQEQKNKHRQTVLRWSAWLIVLAILGTILGQRELLFVKDLKLLERFHLQFYQQPTNVSKQSKQRYKITMIDVGKSWVQPKAWSDKERNRYCKQVRTLIQSAFHQGSLAIGLYIMLGREPYLIRKGMKKGQLSNHVSSNLLNSCTPRSTDELRKWKKLTKRYSERLVLPAYPFRYRTPTREFSNCLVYPLRTIAAPNSFYGVVALNKGASFFRREQTNFHLKNCSTLEQKEQHPAPKVSSLAIELGQRACILRCSKESNCIERCYAHRSLLPKKLVVRWDVRKIQECSKNEVLNKKCATKLKGAIVLLGSYKNSPAADAIPTPFIKESMPILKVQAHTINTFLHGPHGKSSPWWGSFLWLLGVMGFGLWLGTKIWRILFAFLAILATMLLIPFLITTFYVYTGFLLPVSLTWILALGAFLFGQARSNHEIYHLAKEMVHSILHQRRVQKLFK